MKKVYIACTIGALLILFLNYKLEKIVRKKPLEKIILMVDDAGEVNLGYIVIKKNKKYGIINTSGKYIKSPNYDLIKKINSKMYFLKNNNELSIYNIKLDKELKIDYFSYIGNKLYKASLNNKYGIIDENLNIKIDMINDEIYSNNKNILVLNEKEKYLLDKNFNKKILKNYYSNIQLGIGNYLYINSDNKYGIIDFDEIVKISPKYNELVNLNNKNILIGYIGKENYFINLDKNIEKKINYENYSMESMNRAMVLKNGKIGYINELGEEVISTEYDGGFLYKEEKDFIQLKKEDSWYLLNLKTSKSKKIPFEDIGEYKDGLMVVKKEEKFGYIDKEGKIKIPLNYTIAEDFNNGLAIVSSDKGFGVINKKGKRIIPLLYDEILIKDSYIYIKKDRKYGLYSKKGEEILPIIYDKLGTVNEDFIFFKNRNEAGLIKLNGENNGN